MLTESDLEQIELIEYNSSRDGRLVDHIDWRNMNASINNKLTYIINKK